MKRFFAVLLTIALLMCMPAATGEGVLETGAFWRFNVHSGLMWVIRRDVNAVQVYTEAGDLISEFDPGFELMYAQVYGEYDYAYFVADDGTAQTIMKIDMEGKVVGEWPVAPEMHVRQVEPMDGGLLLIIDKSPNYRYGDMDGLDNYGFFELYEMSLADGSMKKIEEMPEISWVQYNGQYIVGVEGVHGNMYVMDAESRDIELETIIEGLYSVELFSDNTGVYLVNDTMDVEEFSAALGVLDVESGVYEELLRIPGGMCAVTMAATEEHIYHAFWADEALSIIDVEW